MPRLRRNEWNFAGNAAQIITKVLNQSEFVSSPLGHAEAELTELRGAKRLDLVIFQRQTPTEPLITGELKVPWDAQGRTPYNSKVVADAHGKASRAGALYFVTWNVRRLVVWKTDDPGIALLERVIYDKEVVPNTTSLESQADLDKIDVRDAISEGIHQLLAFLHQVLTGPPAPTFLPLDRLFIARLESALDFPILETAVQIRNRIRSDNDFKTSIEKWMRDVQGWVVTDATQSQNVIHAARFTCYVLVNRLCFYDALRRKYGQLPRLSIPNNVTTGDALKRKLGGAFEDAKRYTGNYETVFDGDYGDNLPFLSDDAVVEWRNLIRSLDRYDFANISLDVIGAMYEQLIKPAERHRYGQHYTQPAVVDLIASFAMHNGRERLLDPGCGGGTFLVRSYARKAYLDPTQDHSELLEDLYGCDILNYACHLSIINLAIRDLIDDDNFPRIHLGDFLRYSPGTLFSEQPVRIQAGGLVTEKKEINLDARTCDAIVGNPPYISAKEMRMPDKEHYFQEATRRWPQYSWRKSGDIYSYFWLHAEQFLKRKGCLALLTQAAWLDVDYGIPLQEWMLDNFCILAILETEAEPWFTDARVATVVTILQQEDDPHTRATNRVRFVQFRSRLLSIVGSEPAEPDRQKAFEKLRDKLLQTNEDISGEHFRVRILPQEALEESGQDGEQSYIGSKWGRYLRSTETLYSLQKQRPREFVPLRALGDIRRGTTTNRDDFFIVTDISEESLHSIKDARLFRSKYHVDRRRVEAREVRVVSRKDGVELALETLHLRPIIKTARDVKRFSTSHIDHDFAVFLPGDRVDLSRLARAYVEAGEREGWHRAPSFEAIRDAGGNWYTLRESEFAPILLVKTMQYSPFVLWNDGELLANQRLYNLRPLAGVDPLALCAVLNSTIFACERYAAVKALGREAAIDVEVFSANAYRTPDIRRLSESQVDSLRDAMRSLANRDVGSMLEDELSETSYQAALDYAHRQQIQRGVWPAELVDSAREQIDEIVLRLIGVPLREIGRTRERIVNELLAHTRKLKILELEAQINRQGQDNDAHPSARNLADTIWRHVENDEKFQPQHVPDDFFPPSIRTRTLNLPPGRSAIEHPNLFESNKRFVVRAGRTSMEFGSLEEALYVSMLSDYGVSGDVEIPVEPKICKKVVDDIQQYHTQFSELFQERAADVTSDEDFQRRIVKEGWKRTIER